MSKTRKIVCIMGKAGAGKDALLSTIMQAQNYEKFHEIISYTTRPKREGEVEGVNYYYVTQEQFDRKLLAGEMLEATNFRDWCYGVAEDCLDPDKINIGVFNPAGVEFIGDRIDIDQLIVLVEAPDKLRVMRQLNRETNPDVYEIVRRFSADEEDFKEFVWPECAAAIKVINDGRNSLEALAKFVVDYALDWANSNNNLT